MPWLGEEKEHLIIHSKKLLETENYDFFVYGHRHVVKELIIEEKSKVVYLGDWFINFTYGVFDGEDLTLVKYEQ